MTAALTIDDVHQAVDHLTASAAAARPAALTGTRAMVEISAHVHGVPRDVMDQLVETAPKDWTLKSWPATAAASAYSVALYRRSGVRLTLYTPIHNRRSTEQREAVPA